jgi:hypothetical protein
MLKYDFKYLYEQVLEQCCDNYSKFRQYYNCQYASFKNILLAIISN